MVRIIILALMVVSVSGCKELTGKVNEIIQSSRGELQSKRAITISEETLGELDRIDIALAIDKETLIDSASWILAELNNSEEVKKESLEFRDLSIALDQQQVSINIIAQKPVEDFVVTARVQLSAILGATANAIHWNLYVDGLEVLQIEGSPFFSRFRSHESDAVLAELDSLLGLINVIIDHNLNDDPEKSVLLSFDKKKLVEEQLRKPPKDEEKGEKPEALILDEKLLVASMETVATGILVNQSGVFVAAKVRFVGPKNFTERLPDFPPDDSLIYQNSAGVAERIEAYQIAIQEKLKAGFGPDFDPFASGTQTGVLASKEVISRLFAFLVGSGGVAGTLTINESQSSSSEITFEIHRRECNDYFGLCQYKDICDGNNCLQTVNREVEKACKVLCCVKHWPWPAKGCALELPNCDGLCKSVVAVTEPITGAHCDAFRAADALHGGALCTAASNVDKATCDINANLDKSLCDVEQEIARFYTNNPVATVKATMEPKAAARVEITKAAVAQDLSTLSVEFLAKGSGDLRLGLNYDRHNYADVAVVPPEISLGLACAVDWAESIDLSVDIPEFTESLTFKLSHESVDEGLRVKFSHNEERTVWANFSPSPLGALFGGKPQVTLNCPLAALGSFVAAIGEAAFTQEDARAVLPLLTGENYPQKVKDVEFNLILEPLPICSSVADEKQTPNVECPNPLMTLHASIGEKAVIYSTGN